MSSSEEEVKPKKTFEEWLDETWFEFAGRTITRRMWWMDNEITAAKEAWEEARKTT